MVGRLGVEGEPRHERDRVGKAAERELLADGVAFERPAIERLQPLVDLRVGQPFGHTVSIQKKVTVPFLRKQRGQSPFFAKKGDSPQFLRNGRGPAAPKRGAKAGTPALDRPSKRC